MLYACLNKFSSDERSSKEASHPAGVSYPPTPYIPLPFKTLDPWLGSRVLKGKGQGQPDLTLGLPPLITRQGC